MKIQFVQSLPVDVPVIIGVSQDGQLCKQGQELDHLSNGALSRTLTQNKFTGKLGSCYDVVLPDGQKFPHAFVFGLGDLNDMTPLSLKKIGGHLAAQRKRFSYKKVSICFHQLSSTSFSQEAALAHVATGFLLRAWEFKKYKTMKSKDASLVELEEMTFVCASPETAEKAFAHLKSTVDGVYLTRDLVSEPSNVIFPKSFVEQAKNLKSLGVKVEALGEEEMQKLGMNALLGVGQGSAHESQLLVMSWQGGEKNEPPIAIVGKGVTFDTGGISLKPSAGMDEMKMDMGGAGVVLGLISALASRKAKVNVVGVAGLVENMPSGTAQKPGDIVKSMSGQTIEVLDTDAEGRLVLADALWYTQDRFKPKLMINLATLTGAILICLGHEMAGLFSNTDDLANKLLASGQAVDELLWRLPLSEAFDKDIDSEIADVKNLGAPRLAGSTAAAQFLQRFVNKVPWAHLDIAGTAWIKKDRDLSPKGATGFGVRLLEHFIRTYYEGA